MSFQPPILALLEASLLRPLVLVAAAWLILRVLHVRHPASRHAVWTAVLAGMLALPFLSVVTPDWTLRVLPWAQEAALHSASSAIAPAVVPADGDVVDVSSETAARAESGDAPRAALAWPSMETLIVWCYFAGLLAMVVYRTMGWVLLRRVVARSTALRPVCLRESADVVTPVAVGVVRPAVILPAGWRAWTAQKRRAVLAHEFAHLRRRDTLVAALARLVKCVFWFHPVAWWVSRKTSDLAELACDAVALQRVGDPAGYSRVLVEFAASVRRSGQRVALPGLAIASGSRMGDRIDEVFELSGGTMKKLARPIAWLLAVGLPTLGLAATVALSASAPAVEGVVQTQAGQSSVSKPRFEAATIKPCPPEDTPPSNGGARGTAGGTNAGISPGRFTVPCVTTEQLVYLAYASYGARPEERLQNDDFGTASSAQKIRGGPDWVHSASAKYTIEAIAPGVSERTVLMGSMLQTLLEERFQLDLHRESEEVAMFALTVAQGGFKLKPMKGDECDPNAGPPPNEPGAKPRCGNLMMTNAGGVSRWRFSGSPISSLASMLSRSLGVHVIDRTNITDRFMMEFNFFVRDGSSEIRDASGRDVTDSVLSGPSVGQALNDQLGLKLDRIKAPREYIVIDYIQRPTPDDRATPVASIAQTSTQAQAPPLQASTFDAASIKPCAGPPAAGTGRSSPPYSAQISPGYVHWDCISLYELIHQAYAGRDNSLLNNRIVGPGQGDPWLVQGGPDWVMKDRFTIEIRISGEVPRPDLTGSALLIFRQQEMAPALRALLEDRFQLKLRRVTGERPMYALAVAKGGLRLNPATPGDCWDFPPNPDGTIPRSSSGRGGVVPGVKPADAGDKPRCGAGFGGLGELSQIVRAPPSGIRDFQAGNITMQDFALFLSRQMDRWVTDKTGIQTRYTFRLRYIVDESTPGTVPGMSQARLMPESAPGRTIGGASARSATPQERADGHTIFEALARAGLELVKTNGPAEHFVIDTVQRPKPNGPDADALAPARAVGAGPARQGKKS
jgi:uncharacterized protein (TIGR03435 family)